MKDFVDNFLLALFVAAVLFFLIFGGDPKIKSGKHTGGSYVRPHVTRTGKIVKGHYRKSYSTSPNTLLKREKSKYYYKTHKF